MIWFRLFLISQLLLNSLVILGQPPRAPNQVSGSEIVAAVNVLRAEYGLPPYQLDENLMSIGQAQSDYQASIKTLTHTRPDGSGPSMSSENIALGTAGESADTIVRRWTGDAAHTITLIGFRTGLAGAGASTGSDGLIYYTLDVTNTGKTLTGLTINALPTGAASSTSGTPPATQIPIHALLTATPQADGSVIHTVSYGQSLSSIANAYLLTLKDLVSLNHISNPNNPIQIGQKLLVRPSSTATLPPTPTATPLPVTATFLPSPTPPTPSATPQPTPIDAAPPSRPLNLGPSQWIGLGIAFLGLVIAFIGRSLKRKPPV